MDQERGSERGERWGRGREKSNQSGLRPGDGVDRKRRLYL